MPTIHFKYCLTCGYSDLVFSDGTHLVASGTPIGLDDYDYCRGPFAECPPPDDLPEDWQDDLPAPSADEYYNVFSQFDFDIESDRLVLLELI